MDNNCKIENAPFMSGLHEECGVFGIYDFNGKDVASSVYYGLFCTVLKNPLKPLLTPVINHVRFIMKSPYFNFS